MMDRQVTDTIMMIRPHHFGFNAETSGDNAFQSSGGDHSSAQIKTQAQEEFDNMVEMLRHHDITVEVFDDTSDPPKPDAVFPNNWVSFHEDGAIITYPLLSPLRRSERREDIIDVLSKRYGFERRYSFEQYELKNQFLESTGSMVLDRPAKTVFVCLSERSNPIVLDKFCALTGFDRVVFKAYDRDKRPVYHTNVMMCIGKKIAIVCLEAIEDPNERRSVVDRLQNNGKEICEISMDQMYAFAGNMLELQGKKGQSYLVMSRQAFLSLTPDQMHFLKASLIPLYTSLDFIEQFGGGSARCMMAEIFYPTDKAR